MLRGISGVAIGSDESGGVKNVSVSNCIFNGTDMGILMKATRDRGGLVENISFKDIYMKNIRSFGILIELYDHSYSSLNTSNFKPEPVSESTPIFKNILLSNLSGNAIISTKLKGLPESPLKNVTLSQINIIARDGLTVDFVDDLKLNQFSHKSLK